ncbi:MAG TPA: HEAT repeat domain-containing protein [Tepidisphaeraceae bacterium]|nr:HEAT repeat domain-containing protein [Tepidisphaeraceae bacterium]
MTEAHRQLLAKAISDLRSNDPRTLDEALDALNQLGPEAASAVDALAPCLKDNRILSYPSANILGHTRFEVSMRAVRVLQDIGPAAAPTLLSGLSNTDDAVRYEIAFALACVDPQIEAKQWVGLLGDDSAPVREVAATALGKLKAASAVEALSKSLVDRDKKVRQTAAEALGKIGDARAIEPLIATLSDTDPFVRLFAGEALARLGTPAIEAVVGKFDTFNEQERSAGSLAIQKCDATSINMALLTQCLESKHWELRDAATCAVARLKTPVARNTVAAMLKDEFWEVRWTAVRCLGEMVDVEAAANVGPILTDVMKHDKDPRVRTEAVWAVYMLPGNPPADFWKDLDSAASDVSDEVRHADATAIAKFWEPRLIPALIHLLGDAVPYVRQEAAVTAGSRKIKEAVPRLTASLDDADLQSTESAAIALGQIGTDHAVEALIHKVQDASLTLDRRKSVLHGLCCTKNRKAIEPLITAAEQRLDNPRVLTALEELTGQKFRSDIPKWRKWFNEQKEVKPDPRQ